MKKYGSKHWNLKIWEVWKFKNKTKKEILKLRSFAHEVKITNSYPMLYWLESSCLLFFFLWRLRVVNEVAWSYNCGKFSSRVSTSKGFSAPSTYFIFKTMIKSTTKIFKKILFLKFQFKINAWNSKRKHAFLGKKQKSSWEK